jgi:uncharacterized protein (DUF58 family)
MNPRDCLRPEVLAKLARLDLVARLAVEGFITGLHRSPYHGFSVEFSEHRPYLFGDSTKDIDWKVFAKTDRLYVKRYEEETNLKTTLVVDASGSMGFTSGGVAKLDYARYLAAALAYLMLRQRDGVGLILFGGGVRTVVPPRAKPGHLGAILGELARMTPTEGTALEPALHYAVESARRRGLAILISDLFDDPQRVLRGLRHWRYAGHEVIVFHVLDPRELDLGFERSARFVDLEGASTVRADPWHLRGAYIAAMDEMIATYRTGCAEARIDYVGLRTTDPLDHALFEYLSKRKRLG